MSKPKFTDDQKVNRRQMMLASLAGAAAVLVPGAMASVRAAAARPLGREMKVGATFKGKVKGMPLTIAASEIKAGLYRFDIVHGKKRKSVEMTCKPEAVKAFANDLREKDGKTVVQFEKSKSTVMTKRSGGMLRIEIPEQDGSGDITSEIADWAIVAIVVVVAAAVVSVTAMATDTKAKVTATGPGGTGFNSEIGGSGDGDGDDSGDDSSNGDNDGGANDAGDGDVGDGTSGGGGTGGN